MSFTLMGNGDTVRRADEILGARVIRGLLSRTAGTPQYLDRLIRRVFC
jgi:hypothetical protein